MNIARIRLTTPHYGTSENTLEATDYLNVRTNMGLSKALFAKQQADCKLEMVSVTKGQITMRSLGLTDKAAQPVTTFSMGLGESINLLDPAEGNADIRVELLATRVNGEFSGPEF